MALPVAASTPEIFPNMIYIDPINGVPLVGLYQATVVGTPNLPVNNFPDAVTLAGLRNTNNFHLQNILTLTQNMAGPYNFFGDGDIGQKSATLGSQGGTVNLNNFDVTDCTFHDLNVVGSSSSGINCYNCFVSGSVVSGNTTPALIAGACYNCIIGSVGAIPGNMPLSLFNCDFLGGSFFQTTYDGGYMSVSGGTGGFKYHLSNNALSLLYFEANDASILLSSDNTNGNVVIYWAAAVYNYSNTPAFVFYDYATYRAGKIAVFSKHITSAANAGDVVAFTTNMGRIKINSVIERSNGATTANLTTAAVYCETNKAVTLISTLLAAQANLASDGAQVQGVGPWTLEVGRTGIISLVGTGNTPVDITLDVEFEAVADGAYLS